MTPELHVLILAALLQVVQIGLYSLLGNAQLGLGAALSPRDDVPELTGIAGRAKRAMNNHFEGLILFAIAAVTVTLADKSTGFTAAMASVYLIARIVYIPCYLQGLAPWRSLVWSAGFLATFAMLIAALL